MVMMFQIVDAKWGKVLVDAMQTDHAAERQAFVKCFGTSMNRADRWMDVFEEVCRSGSLRACTCSNDKRPRNVKDGAIWFTGRIVQNPSDILIYGRAIGMRHEPGRDDATAENIALRPWKVDWPHYTRVNHTDFMAGTLVNGISLNELMNALKSDASMPTQLNAAKGGGNNDSPLRHATGIHRTHPAGQQLAE